MFTNFPVVFYIYQTIYTEKKLRHYKCIDAYNFFGQCIKYIVMALKAEVFFSYYMQFLSKDMTYLTIDRLGT